MTIQAKISVAVAGITMLTAIVASSSAPAPEEHRHHRARHAVISGSEGRLRGPVLAACAGLIAAGHDG
jgi:hypothetical protein